MRECCIPPRRIEHQENPLAALAERLASVPVPGLDARRTLTLRSPSDLMSFRFDDSDRILGDRLLAKGQPLVIAGQGGTGKSRLVLQMIAAIVTGREWLDFTTQGTELRWLVLQTENSNRRLQHDFAKIRTWLGDDWLRFSGQVVIHTIEHDQDGFVSLDGADNQQAIQNCIEAAQPDCIVIDPLNDFAAGDLNSDRDMKVTLQTLSRICRRGNPERAILVLHHSLTGKAGAQRATGFDRTSFSRNSKALFAWTRGQVNLAPVEADSNDRLVVACGKCSNGKEFAPFGIVLNPETMIYEVDPEFDLETWQGEIGSEGKKQGPDLSPKAVAGVVAELCKDGGAPKRPAIIEALMGETGCGKSGAYKAIDRAERARKIQFNKGAKTYGTR